MKSVVRISLVALLLAGFAAPASATPASTPTQQDDSTTSFGKIYIDWCIFPPSAWCDWKTNRWYS